MYLIRSLLFACHHHELDDSDTHGHSFQSSLSEFKLFKSHFRCSQNNFSYVFWAIFLKKFL